MQAVRAQLRVFCDCGHDFIISQLGIPVRCPDCPRVYDVVIRTAMLETPTPAPDACRECGQKENHPNHYYFNDSGHNYKN